MNASISDRVKYLLKKIKKYDSINILAVIDTVIARSSNSNLVEEIIGMICDPYDTFVHLIFSHIMWIACATAGK